jgi:ABC-type nitrate/sulfonate/bicarbonate transport system substrate-binding protein
MPWPARRLTWMNIIVLLLLPLWFCSAAGAAEKVRISVTNYNMSYLAAGVAAKKGFFKDESLDPEIIRMNFNVAMSALINGEVDYAMIFGSVVRAAMRSIPVKVVAVLIEAPLRADLQARVQVRQRKMRDASLRSSRTSRKLRAVTPSMVRESQNKGS